MEIPLPVYLTITASQRESNLNSDFSPIAGQAGVVGVSFNEGLIVDASVGGGSFFIDGARNRLIYGNEVTLDKILSGQKEAPHQFKPLYEALAEVSSRAAQAKEA